MAISAITLKERIGTSLVARLVLVGAGILLTTIRGGVQFRILQTARLHLSRGK